MVTSKQEDVPVYKIQYWDKISLCWIDIQKLYPFLPYAQSICRLKAQDRKTKCRILEITDKSRAIVFTVE